MLPGVPYSLDESVRLLMAGLIVGLLTGLFDIGDGFSSFLRSCC